MKIKFGKKAKKAGDKADTPAPSVPLWMQTYGDFVTLLLTFFVLLLATMSQSTSDSTIQLLATAFQGAFGSMPGGNTLTQSSLIYGGASFNTLPSDDKGSSMAKNITTGSVASIQAQLQAELQSKKVRVSEDERGFIISLRSDTYFKPASAEIEETQENTETFIKLASLLSTLQNDIRIEGHSDPGSIREGSATSKKYANNWELSIARAMAVLTKLFNDDQTGKLDRFKYSVAGYSDTRPVASNDLPDGRALNRRVDIVIVRQDVTYYNQK